MAANDRQVGGDHYKNPVQHWDWAQFLGYLEGVSSKYLGRHNVPGGRGIEDIEKSLHYIQKIVERDYKDVIMNFSLLPRKDYEVNPDRDQTIKEQTT